jgi:predicted dehydrogenase
MHTKNKLNKKIYLFGSGPMAVAYSKVLDSLSCDYLVFGRGKVSAQIFTSETKRNVYLGPLENYLKKIDLNTYAVVAVSNENLYSVTARIINCGVKNILLEKPGALTIEGIKELSKLAHENKCNVFIALNRRFYSSTLAAKRIIEEDGGVTSCFFSFTEWLDKMPYYPKEVLNTWMVSNPIHVLDHFINFCGKPKQIESFQKAPLDWHPAGSIFVGAGVTEKNIPFSYHSNWESAGRWRVELLTKKRNLIFSPMEKLFQIKKNTIDQEEIQLNDSSDINFKPGILKQVKAFLDNDKNLFVTLEQQLENFHTYYKIAGYSVEK